MKYDKQAIDALDQKLIDQLSQDGRKSFTDIANALQVAVSTIRSRYQRLVEADILHVVAWVNPREVSPQVQNRVNLEIRPSKHIESVAKEIGRIKEVSFVAITSGESNIEIVLTCIDNDHFLQVMNNRILLLEGVHQYSSTTYFEIKKWGNKDVTPTPKIISFNEAIGF